MSSDHQWIVLRTEYDHCIKIFMKRHPKAIGCFDCRQIWTKSFFANFYSRAKIAEADLSSIALWTLGTSLTEGSDNRKTITQYWNRFRASMNKYTNWHPIMKVIEAGSRGNRLHIHFLSSTTIKHHVVLRHWRRITKEKSNVNFQKSAHNVNTAINYLIKYIVKTSVRYSWLGKFRGAVNTDQKERVQCEHSMEFKYYNEFGPWDGRTTDPLY